ncbi:MAG: hypothetical protein BMS9Abin23_0444 [Thermodesulfobacteriota bacterium]|nr:MAG: hypothetical protein BMS9Abin23_0444 [Thermodesulfobacteriota bacterium]
MINHIYIMRYVIIPLAGFLAGAPIALFIYRRLTGVLPERVEGVMKRRGAAVLISFISVYSLYYLTTIFLRYYTHHTQFFDFGIYDWRIWLIQSLGWSDWVGKIRSSLNGHFQPVLVLYSILYDVGFSPVVLNLLQALAVISGALPLYLIARRRLKSETLVTAVVLLYFFYPATQFNIAIDFHPDNLIIPIMFWSYFLVERERYGWLLLTVAAGFLVKEPFMLAYAFFGIYIALEKKRYGYGAGLFIISMAAFFIVTFFVSSSLQVFQHSETITGEVAYGYLFAPGGVTGAIRELLRFEKWRFPLFLLAPLLFLPLLKFWVFLPAVPIIAILLLSTVSHHQNVASQYTAALIPPIFVSLVPALQYLHQRLGKRAVFSLISFIFVLVFAFNMAHSPGPLAVAFWKDDWSHGRWHYKNYLANKNFSDINRAIDLIPEDPSVRVVTHSLIYDSRLAHRYSYGSFPTLWQEADYILLDNNLDPYVVDSIDGPRYRQVLTALSNDDRFFLYYKKGGVVLYKRRPGATRNPDRAR